MLRTTGGWGGSLDVSGNGGRSTPSVQEAYYTTATAAPAYSYKDYLRMRRWLAGLLLLDGMLAVVWMLVLAYGYGLGNYWKQTYDTSYFGRLYEADSIGDLLTLALSRCIGILPMYWHGNGKWLLSPSLAYIIIFVLVFSFAWVPFKAGLFFDLQKFNNATHSDGAEGDGETWSAGWVAVCALIFAGVLPLVETLLFRLTVYTCRIYLIETTSGSSVAYQTKSNPVIGVLSASGSMGGDGGGGRSSETEPLLRNGSALSAAAAKKIDEMNDEERTLNTMSVRGAWRKAGWFSRVFALYQFGLLRHGYKGPLNADYIWNLPDTHTPQTLHKQYNDKIASAAAAAASKDTLLRTNAGDPPLAATPASAFSGWMLYNQVKGDLWSAVLWSVRYQCTSPYPRPKQPARGHGQAASSPCAWGGAEQATSALFVKHVLSFIFADVRSLMTLSFQRHLVEAAAMVTAPVLLKEMITWIDAPCYEYNPLTNNASSIVCDCALDANCRRIDDGSLIPLDQRPNWFTWGVQLSIILFVLALVMAVARGQEMRWSGSLSSKLQTVMAAVVYPHILKASSQTRRAWTSATIADLGGKDTDTFGQLGNVAARALLAPVVVVVGGWLSIQIAGWQAVLAGLGSMVVVTMPVVYMLSTSEHDHRKIASEQASLRARKIKEAVMSLRYLDLVGWLKHTKASLVAAREDELGTIYNLALAKHLLLPLSFTLPSVAAVVTFAVYVVVPQGQPGGPDAAEAPSLTPGVAFPILLLYIAVVDALLMLPVGVASFLRARDLSRVYAAFFAKTGPYRSASPTSNGYVGNSRSILVSGATFAYGNDDEPGSSSSSRAVPHAPQQHVLIEATEENVPWERQTSFVKFDAALTDINLEVGPGAFVGLVGEGGSGKSSLCKALINAMHRVRGILAVNARLAYVPQVPYFTSGSIHENILFGLVFDQDKYTAVVQACQLEETTFDHLVGGDMANTADCVLTREQQMRISIARALYTTADVIVMDDSFSTMDATTATELLSRIQDCISSAGTSIVLATHQACLLQTATEIVMLKAGAIVKRGVYDDFTGAGANAGTGGANFAEMASKQRKDPLNKAVVPSAAGGGVAVSGSGSGAGAGAESGSSGPFKRTRKLNFSNSNRLLHGTEQVLPAAESKAGSFVTGSGTTPWKVYTGYMKSGSGAGSLVSFVLLAACLLLSEVLFVSKDVWLAEWSVQVLAQQNGSANISAASVQTGGVSDFRRLAGLPAALAYPTAPSTLDAFGPSLLSAQGQPLNARPTLFFVAVYCGIAAALVVLVLLAACLLARFQRHSSRHFHARLLNTLLRRPKGAPSEGSLSARVLRECVDDVAELDLRLLDLWHFSAMCGVRVVFSLLFITVVVNFFGAFFLAFVLIYALLFEHYRCTSRQLHRIEEGSRTKLYAHVSDTVNGLLCIRAFRVPGVHLTGHALLLQQKMQATSARRGVESWAGTWFGIIGAFCVLITTLLLAIDPDAIDTGLAACAIVYSFLILSHLNAAVRFTTELEANMRCVDRVRQRGTGPLRLASSAATNGGKAGDDDDDDDAEEDVDGTFGPLPGGWPTVGAVRFGVVDVPAGATVGLTCLGMKGGMQTVTAAFLGDTVDHAAAFKVTIDGVDLSQITKSRLRASVTYIPAVSVLFEGTVRTNLDPTQTHADATILACLERCYLREMIENFSDGLATPVLAGGANFTPAEQRMLTMCRALLQQLAGSTKVLVVEDTHEGLDNDTDCKWQTVLRSASRACTTVIVSQRPQTIIDADIIAGFQQDRIVERGTPAELLEKVDGVFATLVARLGPAASKALLNVVTSRGGGGGNDGSSSSSSSGGASSDLLLATLFTSKPTPFTRATGLSNFKQMSFEPKGRAAPDVVMKPLWNSLPRIISFAYFTYVFPLLALGSKRVLELSDLYQLAPRLKGKPLTDRAEAMYSRIKDQKARKGLKGTPGGLGWAFLWAFRAEWMKAGFWMFSENLFALSQSVLLAYFLNGLEDPTTTNKQLYVYAALISAASFMRMSSMHLCAYYNWLCGLSMRSAAIGMLYRKVLSLRATSMTKMQSGKIITIISADVERFTMAWFMHGMWLAPIMIAATVAIGWQQIGSSILAGIAITFIMLPIQMKIGKKFAKARSETATRTDKRVNAMNDILQGMRTVKMAAWETPLSANVAELRKNETSRIWVAAQLKAFTLSFFFAGAHFPTFASIATYSATGGILTPANVFSVFTLFGAMRMVTAAWLPMGINAFSELKISLGRMQDLLDLDDDDCLNGSTPPTAMASSPSSATPRTRAVPGSVVVAGMSAGWNLGADGRKDVLNGVDFTIGTSTPSAAAPLVRDGSGISTASSDASVGETLVVLGAVGVGKSTLLLAMLDELQPTAGTIEINGLATLYAPQKAWIFPGSVRDNITFTYRYDAEWMARVVDACALTRDLGLFEAGIDTEIGERGVTLSGGQKARLSLARCIYGTKFASAEAGTPCLVLLDDPFSALDTKVQQEVFQKVVLGLLKRHAVVCITHNHKFAKHADKVLVLDHNGVGATHVGMPPSLDARISNTGDGEGESEDSLGNASVESDSPTIDGDADGVKASLDGAAVVSAATSETATAESAATSEAYAKKEATAATDLDAARDALVCIKAASSVVVKETQDVGAVSRHTYTAYIAAIGSPFLTAMLAIVMCAAQGALVGTDFYLAEWSRLTAEEQVLERTSGSYRHLILYSVFFVATMLMLFGRSSMFMTLALRAARGLHNVAFSRIMGCSIRFFDTQPVGRILNRFAKDMAYVDELLPETTFDFLQLALWSVAIVILVCSLDPYTLLAVSPAIVVIIWMRSFNLQASREIKRVEAKHRSPIYAHVSRTIDGLFVLHSFPGATKQYLDQFEHFMSEHIRAFYNFVLVSRWLGSRLDMIVCVITVIVVFTSVGKPGAAADTGLSLSYLLQLTGIFQWMIRQSAEVENQLTSCERIVEYSKLPAEEETPGIGGGGGGSGGGGGGDTSAGKYDAATSLLPIKGMHGGDLEVSDLKLWYGAGMPNVLNGLNFKIESGEKVGVIGRTGAGKSSLLAAILRLAPTSGTVKIAGVPTSTLPLKVLRRYINVIPQDTMLFNGTVRMNLDPFNEAADDDIWRALERVQLKRKILSLEGGLGSTVQEFGSNFSAGERQLLCLARAIIRSSQILILDEATANVDTATDVLIQSVIKEHFAACTVITIAHRLNTIMHSDKLLVLDAGKVIEFGSPDELQKVEGGVFRSLLDAQGGAGNEGGSDASAGSAGSGVAGDG